MSEKRISFALSAQIKEDRFYDAVEWAKERAASVTARSAGSPVTLHVPIAGKENTIVFVQGFDSLNELHEFQTNVESDGSHRESMIKGIREFFIEGTVESTIYERVV